MLKRKFIITFLISIFFILLISSCTFAFSIKTEEGEVIDFGDNIKLYNKNLVFKSYNSLKQLVGYKLFSFSGDFYLSQKYSEVNVISYKGHCYQYLYLISNNSVSFYDSTADSSFNENVFNFSSSLTSEALVFNDFDICDEDGNVVFHAPVKPSVVVRLEKVEELPNLINQLVMIILPVGLKIFSVLLAIYLIASKKWRSI